MSDKPKASLAGCIVELVALPFLVLLRAYVLRALWGWFVVPLGVPSIGTLEAIGLGLTVSYLTYQPTVSPFKDDANPWLNRICTSVLVSLGIWGVGWIVAVGLA